MKNSFEFQVSGYRFLSDAARFRRMRGRSTSFGIRLFALRITKILSAVGVLLLLSAFATAQNITGTVTNGTTGKPAAGDVVSLLSLTQGMQETAHTKSNAEGRFSLPAPADQRAPNMVRVTHAGVNYFPQGGPLMPGSTTADITVYDAAKKVEGITETVEVNRYQTDGSQLQGIVLYAIKNDSKPPRSLSGDATFQFALPAGAEIDSAYAKSPGGQPVASAASPAGQKNVYAFGFPLRPGETQFQVSYHMPYSGEASFTPKPLAEVQHFVVMTPKGISFEPKDAQQFKSMPDDTGSTIMVATNVKPGQDLAFRIAGKGAFQTEQDGGPRGGAATSDAGSSGAGAMGGAQAAGRDNRPGGGLGAPIDAPDPLHDYRAYILGAFALVLVMGGAYVVSQSNKTALATAAGGSNMSPAVEEQSRVAPASKGGDRSALLLEAMKEELFQLEVDRAQGKISPSEYEKAKAGLDETIRRALARKGSN